MKTDKWIDLARHSTGCPYKGVAVYGNEAELAKYYSGVCPGCNVPVKWEKATKAAEHPDAGRMTTNSPSTRR